MSWRRTFWIENFKVTSQFINLDVQISPQVWEVLSHYFFLKLSSFLPFLLSFEIPVVHTQSIWCPILNSHRFLHFFSPQVGSFQTLLACWFLSCMRSRLLLKLSLISSVQSLYSSSPKFLLGSFMFSLWTAVLFLYCILMSSCLSVFSCSSSSIWTVDFFDLHFFVVSY